MRITIRGLNGFTEKAQTARTKIMNSIEDRNSILILKPFMIPQFFASPNIHLYNFTTKET